MQCCSPQVLVGFFLSWVEFFKAVVSFFPSLCTQTTSPKSPNELSQGEEQAQGRERTAGLRSIKGRCWHKGALDCRHCGIRVEECKSR